MSQMVKPKFFIRKVAVLGATSIGAQIAALFANAGIESLLYDQQSKEGDPNAIAKAALAALKLHEPPVLVEESLHQYIQPANYEHDGVLLKECDLIIEAISERLDWKVDLYRQIIPFLSPHCFLVSNTSGLSIEKLAEALPESQRPRFSGIHFFNPPRHMHLIELIPHTKTDRHWLEHLESFLVSTLNKGIIYSHDSPGFIANRIGIFCILTSVIFSEEFGLSPDTVDSITGPAIGRSKTATFGTVDLIGLDTLQQMVYHMAEGLVDDPWRDLFQLPLWMVSLIQRGALGRKTKTGIYRKSKEELLVVDKQGNYRPLHQKIHHELQSILKIPSLKERFMRLRESGLPEAKFLWSHFRELFHYSAYHLGSIAMTARDLDLALRWGYGFERGPFELWQAIGWKTVCDWIEEDRNAKLSLTTAPLPSYVYDLGEIGVYRNHTAYSARRKIYLSRSKLPVYQRQIFPDCVLGEEEEVGHTLFENDDLRLWTEGDGIGIASFKTKENTITEGALNALLQSIEIAEKDLSALILWTKDSKNFSLGANLKFMLEAIHKKNYAGIIKAIKLCQQTALALKYAEIPTVAAISGAALGGGLELAMHCTRRVAALESYPGLVETLVGLIPAGGGCKELAFCAMTESKGEESFSIIQHYFRLVREGVKARSAKEAKRLGLLRESDVIVLNSREILYVAKEVAKMLSNTNYRPPLKEPIMVTGRSGSATLQVQLINLREKEIITDHEYLIGSGLAQVLCGGEMEGGQRVPVEWWLDLERQFFMELIQTKKTEERIQNMLEHRKIIRN